MLETLQSEDISKIVTPDHVPIAKLTTKTRNLLRDRGQGPETVQQPSKVQQDMTNNDTLQ
jgi:hypothetical protein